MKDLKIKKIQVHEIDNCTLCFDYHKTPNRVYKCLIAMNNESLKDQFEANKFIDSQGIFKKLPNNCICNDFRKD